MADDKIEVGSFFDIEKTKEAFEKLQEAADSVSKLKHYCTEECSEELNQLAIEFFQKIITKIEILHKRTINQHKLD